jgi:hypothetical protein
MYLYAVGMQELGVAMVWHVSRGSVHAVRQGQCYAQALRVSGLWNPLRLLVETDLLSVLLGVGSLGRCGDNGSQSDF